MMNRPHVAVVALSMLVVCPLAAQDTPQAASDFPPVIKTLEMTTIMDRTMWGLGVQFRETENLKSPEEVLTDVETFSTKGGGTPQERAQQAAVAKYRDPVRKVFGDLKLVGSRLGQFVYVKGSVPVWFAMRDDGMTLLVTGVVSTINYNTLRVTPRERAAEALRSSILPSLKAFAAFRDVSDVKFYGMTVVYGSQDFSDKSPLSTKAETVTLIVPAPMCQKFIAGDLTEDDLLAGGDVYVADRDMVTGVKKIKIRLQ
jgi:hypothetical protein